MQKRNVGRIIIKILGAVGITAGLGTALYNSIDNHIKQQDAFLQNISDQFQKTRSDRLSCLRQQEIFQLKNERYTRNLKEFLSIVTIAREKGEFTQKARSRISDINKENIDIENSISIESFQIITSCYDDVIDSYLKIELNLGMINNREMLLNAKRINENNKFNDVSLKEVDSMYFNDDLESFNRSIQYLSKVIDEKDKIDRDARGVLTDIDTLSREIEFQIEKVILNRKNDNIFEKWWRAIS